MLPESKTYKIKVKELLANDSYKNNNKNKKKYLEFRNLLETTIPNTVSQKKNTSFEVRNFETYPNPRRSYKKKEETLVYVSKEREVFESKLTHTQSPNCRFPTKEKEKKTIDAFF